ncbi:MAG: hypothetical protein IPO91_20420 [Chloroflexi bacterium]|nr:hypothetical protein [Chloroflexota bacterium]
MELWELNQLGESDFIAGRVAEGIEHYSAFLNAATSASKPYHLGSLYAAYLRRGLLHFLNRDYPAAIQDLSFQPAYYYRGLVYTAAQQYAEAAIDQLRFIEDSTQSIQGRLTGISDVAIRGKSARALVQPDYLSLYIAVGRQDIYAHAVRLCGEAIEVGANRDAALFCRAAAYEQQREFFKALDDYRQIKTLAFKAGVDLALERCEKAALYVKPTDRQLMQPHLSYCIETNGAYEFFDLDSYKQQNFVLSMIGWRLVASNFHKEGHEKYFQKRRRG